MRLLLLLVLALPLAGQDSPPSWYWVHAGVAAHAVGSAADGYSSWGGYESNRILRGSDGRFGRGAVGAKAVEFSLGTAASYLVGKRWPRLRRAIGIANISVGAMYGLVAIHNVRSR
jgi:hypothetical protein